MRFTMVLHAHQPPGNFDSAFQRAVEECYRPFLEVIERYPDVRVSLHCSGSLLEWLEVHEPTLIDAIQRMVGRQQMEIVSAGLYEPILALLPERDRRNQLLGHRAYMRRLFGVEPTVGWLTERVWSQPLVGDLVAGGIEAIPLDDLHFLAAGLDAAQLDRPYITEHLGHTLMIVPSPKEMRDAIPWYPVPKAIKAIRAHADRGEPLLVYADDLEKWGLWPGTYKTVYEEHWLEQFFAALTDLAHAHEVDTVPFSEALHDVRPRERVYLPDGSYAEMMQWTLSAATQRREAAFRKHLVAADLWDEGLPFVRSGTYLQFLAKYPEINHLHKRMLDVSARVAARHPERTIARDLATSDELPDAVRSLWRAQANCAYWHGMFGGTYLPFLRQSLFHNLLRAERALERDGEVRRALRTGDLDATFEDSALATTAALTIAISPDDGGSVVELSDREQAYNLVDTLARRDEAYHSGEQPPYAYDEGRRAWFVDRFLPSEPLPALDEPIVDLGAFAGQPYAIHAKRSHEVTSITLERTAAAPGGIAQISKQVRLDDGNPRQLVATYDVSSTAGTLDARLGIELNVAVLFARAQANDSPIDLERGGMVSAAEAITFEGFDPALRLTLTSSAPSELDVRPITTISQSEAGLESIRQCNACLFTWPLHLATGEHFRVELTATVEQRA